MRKKFSAFFLLLCAAVLHAQTNPLNMTTMDVVKDMGLGINLGNTFESTGDWINSSGGVNAYETAWGSPTITKAMIDGYVSGGFKTVRIPVAWSNLMTGNNYTVSTALLNRIDEVVGWVLDNNMYAIINIHWDGGWWENFPTDSAGCMNRYKRIWEQVSDKFKNRSGYLIFESLNEEGVWDDVWNKYDGTGNKARAYGLLNAINQEFTTLVRASGGNNATRHLLIAGYETNIDRTIDAAFKMPTDPQNRQAVSVHYYDPFGFTHLEENTEWAQVRLTWGTVADQTELNSYMDKLKTAFVDNGIPVIVGEYGMATKNRTDSEIRKYTLAVAEAIYMRNMCPVLWDVQGTDYYYDRNNRSFADQQLVSGFNAITGNSISSSSSSDNNQSSSSGGGNPSSSSSGDQTPIRLLQSISLENLPSNTKIKVYNLQGKLLYSANSENSQILKIPVQTKGIYIVKIGTKTLRVPVL
jgi:endoglucanase